MNSESSNSEGLPLRVKDLRVSYGDRVVSHIPSLELAAGQSIGIVGESGSGKSSALMAMLGLSSTTGAQPTGLVTVSGVDMLADTPQARSMLGWDIGLVMQSPQSSLNPTMKLRNLARAALRRHGVSKEDADKRITEAASIVRLDERVLGRYPHEISGGQAQRFVIALAVAQRVRCILADEPTSALDVTVQAEVITLLNRLRHEEGIAMLLISHDLPVVSELTDYVLVMRNGEVVEEGKTPQVFGNPQNEYTKSLLASVPEWQTERPRKNAWTS
ncbi:ATP-binding cassette domain-containing protein [Arthrobacter sp. R4]|uniref:ATP-binding cassette domain-containing protein n=1 Tax=Arthrobacter sp. R4 TaxID=644417 RepID=UPI003EDB07D0